MAKNGFRLEEQNIGIVSQLIPNKPQHYVPLKYPCMYDFLVFHLHYSFVHFNIVHGAIVLTCIVTFSFT